MGLRGDRVASTLALFIAVFLAALTVRYSSFIPWGTDSGAYLNAAHRWAHADLYSPQTLVFRFPWAIEAGRHAWIELLLPTGRKIRPLVAVLGIVESRDPSLPSREGSISARYVHLFPEHRRALDAYLASPSGY